MVINLYELKQKLEWEYRYLIEVDDYNENVYIHYGDRCICVDMYGRISISDMVYENMEKHIKNCIAELHGEE